MNGTLTHYGILGMKWGVRRTPEQLGHTKAQKAAGKLQQYKDKKISKIEKMYAKSIKATEEALEYDPGNKDLTKQLKSLSDLKRKDIDKINSMTYTDVVNEQKEIRQKRIQTAGKVATTAVKTTGEVALWTAKMGLVGVRIYGTFKAASILAEMGGRAINYLNSPEGQELIGKGLNTATSFINFGDKVVGLTNKDLADVIDTKTLVDTAVNQASSYVKEEVRKGMGR